MCGRFVQRNGPVYYLEHLGLDAGHGDLPNAPARYNAAPTQDLLVIRRHPETGEADVSLLHWGLVPSFQQDMTGAARLINARSETVARMAAFRNAWRRGRRCIVPADAFYEWRRTGAQPQPYAFALKGGLPAMLAGLWEGWRDPQSGVWRRTFTILTCPANEKVAAIHHRMPVIIAARDVPEWLGGAAPASLMRPFPAEAIETWPVSARLNSVRNEGADLLAQNLGADVFDERNGAEWAEPPDLQFHF